MGGVIRRWTDDVYEERIEHTQANDLERRD